MNEITTKEKPQLVIEVISDLKNLHFQGANFSLANFLRPVSAIYLIFFLTKENFS